MPPMPCSQFLGAHVRIRARKSNVNLEIRMMKAEEPPERTKGQLWGVMQLNLSFPR